MRIEMLQSIAFGLPSQSFGASILGSLFWIHFVVQGRKGQAESQNTTSKSEGNNWDYISGPTSPEEKPTLPPK
jgi:hypothetical protein